MKLVFWATCLVLWNLMAVATGVKYTLEVYVVVENNVKDHYINSGTSPNRILAKIQSDVEYLMQQTNQIYRRMIDRNVDMEIRIRKLDVLRRNILQSDDSSVALTKLSNFIKGKQANDLFYQRMKFDAALLITGRDVNFNGGNNGGLARINSVCGSLPMAVVEYKGTSDAVRTIAHELGHVLGLHHDDEVGNVFSKCKHDKYKNRDLIGYIMNKSPSISVSKWDFSPCSVDTLIALNPTRTCLLSTSSQSYIPNVTTPKDLTDGQVTCKRTVGDIDAFVNQDSRWYQNGLPAGDIICQRIYCSTPKSNSARTIAIPPEGMACGAMKRCHFGKCQAAPTNFPVPSEVTDKCVFGDKNKFDVFSYKSVPDKSTCSDYFADGTKANHCNDPMMQENCCRTCQNMVIPSGRCLGDSYSIKANGGLALCENYLYPRYRKPLCDTDAYIKKNCCGTCEGFKTGK